MTKLEDEIRLAWLEIDGHATENEQAEMSKAAAEVSRQYIEKAYDAGLARTYLHQGQRKSKEQWLKDNGITE